MTEQKFIRIISNILNKKIIVDSETKLSEIKNIDSLDYVKIIIGLKDYSILISISDIENLTLQSLLEKIKKWASSIILYQR